MLTSVINQIIEQIKLPFTGQNIIDFYNTFDPSYLYNIIFIIIVI